MIGATLVGAPAAHASSGIGVGIVEIFGAEVAGCQTNCQVAFGTGVVVSNPYSTNEVLTVAHVIDAIAPGNTIFIYEPYTETIMAGYVQRKDDPDDLAVLWLYDPTKTWPTAAPTFATTPMSNANPGNGTIAFGEGSSNNPWGNKPATFATENGTLVNNSYNGPNGTGLVFGSRTLYNLMETTYMSQPGDSGGPLYDSTANIYDPNRGTVMGLDEGSDAGPNPQHSYYIQIGWAYWDMCGQYTNQKCGG